MPFTVSKLDENELDALVCQYGGQLQRQAAFIEVDWEEETLSADYDPEIGGGVPANVWHGRKDRIIIPSETLPSEVNRIMEEMKARFDALLPKHEVDWNGSNYVGKWLDDDAGYEFNEIESEIETLCNNATCLDIWDAAEYYQNTHDDPEGPMMFARTLQWDGSGAADEKMANWLRDNVDPCSPEGPVLLTGVRSYVQQICEEI